MTVIIRKSTLGMVATNTYLLIDTTTYNAILIDPVDQPEAILEMATQANATIKLILATHAHFDHVLASAALVEATHAPFWIHAEAAPYLERLPDTGIRFTGKPFPTAATPDKFIADDEHIQLDSIHLQALYTPGHAPGHLSFFMPDQSIVFSGDTLFAGSIGRTDLEGGSLSTLLNSIKTRLLTLQNTVDVYPGHGHETTIGHEKQTNPFLR